MKDIAAASPDTINGKVAAEGFSKMPSNPGELLVGFALLPPA